MADLLRASGSTGLGVAGTRRAPSSILNRRGSAAGRPSSRAPSGPGHLRCSGRRASVDHLASSIAPKRGGSNPRCRRGARERSGLAESASSLWFLIIVRAPGYTVSPVYYAGGCTEITWSAGSAEFRCRRPAAVVDAVTRRVPGRIPESARRDHETTRRAQSGHSRGCPKHLRHPKCPSDLARPG